MISLFHRHMSMIVLFKIDLLLYWILYKFGFQPYLMKLFNLGLLGTFRILHGKCRATFIRWLLVAWDAICARVLSAANTDAPCHRHKTRIHDPVTLSWQRANQSWFYPLNAERLARKQPVPICTPLVWCGRSSNPRPPDYEANALGHWAGATFWVKKYYKLHTSMTSHWHKQIVRKVLTSYTSSQIYKSKKCYVLCSS